MKPEPQSRDGPPSVEPAPPYCSEYLRVLLENKSYRLALASYYVDNIGNWMTFIACISITDNVAGPLYTSYYLIIRLLPPILFVPWIGPLADRINKVHGMVVCSVCAACCVFAMSLFTDSKYALAAIYITTFIQFTLDGLYGPLRSSLIPKLVPRQHLLIATTLDGVGWSAIGALGASLGGWVVGTYGRRASFVIDGFSYLLCAGIVSRIDVNTATAVEPNSLSCTSMCGLSRIYYWMYEGWAPVDLDESALEVAASETELTAVAATTIAVEKDCTTIEAATHQDTYFNQSKGKDEVAVLVQDAPACCKLLPSVHDQTTTEMPHSKVQEKSDTGTFLYMLKFLRKDAFLCALCTLKGCGALLWGAADLLAVQYSQDINMQALGNAEVTMGWIFAASGIGCQLGPALWNCVTDQAERPLLRALAVAFIEMCASYAIMGAASSISAVLAATILRTLGSSVVWIYSTLLMQLTVPSDLQGRVFATERAFYTVSKVVSTLLCGVALHQWDMSAPQICVVMVMASLVICLVWGWLYMYKYWWKPLPLRI